MKYENQSTCPNDSSCSGILNIEAMSCILALTRQQILVIMFYESFATGGIFDHSAYTIRNSGKWQFTGVKGTTGESAKPLCLD